MKNVLLWGMSELYDKYRNQFIKEELKNNINIIGVMLTEDCIYERIDKYPVYNIEQLSTAQVDYIITFAPDEIYSDMRKIIRLLKWDDDRLINGNVFFLPQFDFSLYLRVKESKVSIITNQCWGGYTYHSLDMKFYSPFINLFMNNEDYLKLMNDFNWYMEQPLVYLKELYEINLKRNYPVAQLGDITLHMNHYLNFEEALTAWNKRKNRINYNNLLFVMRIDELQEAKVFAESSPKYKIGFSNKPYPFENIIYLPPRDDCEFYVQVNSCADSNILSLKPYNVLKLLLHKKDYMRLN
ncbi:MAG TPA: DUF1919 domain-containing protein [Lachnospiraceae bacterium]|nr:DUF1919 domain-containing protein [Lachnospiraceae bacterium]